MCLLACLLACLWRETDAAKVLGCINLIKAEALGPVLTKPILNNPTLRTVVGICRTVPHVHDAVAAEMVVGSSLATL